MATYDVTVTEILSRTVTVSAASEQEASTKVELMYDNEEIVLTADDFEDVVFSEAELVSETSKEMDVLLVEPGCYPRMVTIENSLQAMQEAVGGPIEVVSLPDAVIVCNEEGKLKGLPPNRPLMDENRHIQDVLMGTFFVCGDQGEQLTSLSEDLRDKYAAQFRQPKAFVRTQRGVMIVSLPSETAHPSPHARLNGQAAKDGPHLSDTNHLSDR